MKKIFFISAIFIFFGISYLTFANSTGVIEKLKMNSEVTNFGKVTTKGNTLRIDNLVIKGIPIKLLSVNVYTKKCLVVVMLKNLKQSFINKNKDIKSLNLKIKNGKLYVSGEAKISILPIHISLEGKLYLYHNALCYTVYKAVMGHFIHLPKSLIDSILKRSNPLFSFNELGFPIYLNKISYTKTEMILSYVKKKKVKKSKK